MQSEIETRGAIIMLSNLHIIYSKHCSFDRDGVIAAPIRVSDAQTAGLRTNSKKIEIFTHEIRHYSIHNRLTKLFLLSTYLENILAAHPYLHPQYSDDAVNNSLAVKPFISCKP